MKLKKLTLRNEKTFFSKIQDGEEFEYTNAFGVRDVTELAKEHGFEVVFIPPMNAKVVKP